MTQPARTSANTGAVGISATALGRVSRRPATIDLAPSRARRTRAGGPPRATVVVAAAAADDRRRSAEVRAFAGAAIVYWAGVFPLVCGELRRGRRRARAIPDLQLRHDALAALAKRSNIEGAAAFATFAPARGRAAAVRASVAFQLAYDYLDVLAERPNPQAVRNATTLNEALIAALPLAPGPGARRLDPCAIHRRSDFYALHESVDDGGYLAAMLASCAQALGELPSYAVAEPAIRRCAERAARFQGFNCGAAQGDRAGMASWARRLSPPDSGLSWWEAAAAAGSSLGVHALIAAAASQSLDKRRVAAIEEAYFPWIGALHSLLDQLIDVQEDARTGQANIALCYRDAAEAAKGLARLTARGRASAATLDTQERGSPHSLLLSAMAANYLSQPEAASPRADPARRAVRAELGLLATASVAVFKVRRRARGR